MLSEELQLTCVGGNETSGFMQKLPEGGGTILSNSSIGIIHLLLPNRSDLQSKGKVSTNMFVHEGCSHVYCFTWQSPCRSLGIYNGQVGGVWTTFKPTFASSRVCDHFCDASRCMMTCFLVLGIVEIHLILISLSTPYSVAATAQQPYSLTNHFRCETVLECKAVSCT